MIGSPDFVIGKPGSPYLLRWWLWPRKRLVEGRVEFKKDDGTLYLHKIVRSDDDRALHDHPGNNLSIVLWGGYWEIRPTKKPRAFGPKQERIWRGAGSIVFRRAEAAHRLELPEGKGCWTLFWMGKRTRQWGFHCPQGWKHWMDFCGDDPGQIGPGCD